MGFLHWKKLQSALLLIQTHMIHFQETAWRGEWNKRIGAKSNLPGLEKRFPCEDRFANARKGVTITGSTSCLLLSTQAVEEATVTS